MFKIGQRVVFVDCHLHRHPHVVYPKMKEIVTIKDGFVGIEDGKLYLILEEYPKPLIGEVNGIVAICFRPIDESFAEQTLERLMKEIKENEEINMN